MLVEKQAKPQAMSNMIRRVLNSYVFILWKLSMLSVQLEANRYAAGSCE